MSWVAISWLYLLSPGPVLACHLQRGPPSRGPRPRRGFAHPTRRPETATPQLAGILSARAERTGANWSGPRDTPLAPVRRRPAPPPAPGPRNRVAPSDHRGRVRG